MTKETAKKIHLGKSEKSKMENMRLYEVTNDELQEVDGGISLVAVGIGILVVSAAVETFNGYQSEKRK